MIRLECSQDKNNSNQLSEIKSIRIFGFLCGILRIVIRYAFISLKHNRQGDSRFGYHS